MYLKMFFFFLFSLFIFSFFSFHLSFVFNLYFLLFVTSVEDDLHIGVINILILLTHSIAHSPPQSETTWEARSIPLESSKGLQIPPWFHSTPIYKFMSCPKPRPGYCQWFFGLSVCRIGRKFMPNRNHLVWVNFIMCKYSLPPPPHPVPSYYPTNLHLEEWS